MMEEFALRLRHFIRNQTWLFFAIVTPWTLYAAGFFAFNADETTARKGAFYTTLVLTTAYELFRNYTEPKPYQRQGIAERNKSTVEDGTGNSSYWVNILGMSSLYIFNFTTLFFTRSNTLFYIFVVVLVLGQALNILSRVKTTKSEILETVIIYGFFVQPLLCFLAVINFLFSDFIDQLIPIYPDIFG